MSELIDELLAEAGERMSAAVQAAQNTFSSVRTGRASPSVLDRIMVDYYGALTPVKLQLQWVAQAQWAVQVARVPAWVRAQVGAHRRPEGGLAW